jgi:hypothetical protein
LTLYPTLEKRLAPVLWSRDQWTLDRAEATAAVAISSGGSIPPCPSMTTNDPDLAPSTTIRVRTPDGSLFVSIVEQADAPRQVLLHIGKSGHSLQAWADALARVVSLALRSGLTLQAVVAEVSNITTERGTPSGEIIVRSGPDGLAHALLQYQASKRRDASDERSASLER